MKILFSRLNMKWTNQQKFARQGAACTDYITFEFSRAFACQQVQNNPLLEIVIFAIGFDIVINCIKDV